MFRLTWAPYGGQRLQMTWNEALELDVADREWLLERSHEQREEEAKILTRGRRK